MQPKEPARPGSRWTNPDNVKRLAAACCNGHKEPARAGSLLCRDCNLVVNPNIKSSAGETDVERAGDWRARLVSLAAEKRLERRAGR